MPELWWLRFYRPRDKHALKGYVEGVFEPGDIFRIIKDQPRIDVVNLLTGQVARHDYKKPIPEWTKDPLLRAMKSVGWNGVATEAAKA